MIEPATVGIAWYRREDYPRILEIMEDAVYAAGFSTELRRMA